MRLLLAAIGILTAMGLSSRNRRKKGVSEWEMREENIFNAFLINFLPRQWAKGRKRGAWWVAKDKVATLVNS